MNDRNLKKISGNTGDLRNRSRRTGSPYFYSYKLAYSFNKKRLK